MTDLRIDDGLLFGIASQVGAAANALDFSSALTMIDDAAVESTTVVSAVDESSIERRDRAAAVIVSLHALAKSTTGAAQAMFEVDADLGAQVV